MNSLIKFEKNFYHVFHYSFLWSRNILLWQECQKRKWQSGDVTIKSIVMVRIFLNLYCHLMFLLSLVGCFFFLLTSSGCSFDYSWCWLQSTHSYSIPRMANGSLRSWFDWYRSYRFRKDISIYSPCSYSHSGSTVSSTWRWSNLLGSITYSGILPSALNVKVA